MNYCPNCGTILKEHEDTCPNCGTKIIIQEKEEIVETPQNEKPKKKEPPRKKKVTQKRTKYKSQSISVKEIPLTVKKTEKHSSADKDIKEYLPSNREDMDKYYKKDELVFNISSIVKVIAVLLLFALTVFVIFKITIDNSKKSLDNPPAKEVVFNASIYNHWESSSGGEFVFNEDESFYWYRSIGDLNNYYYGTFSFITGPSALEEMGYTEEEFKSNFGEDIAIENVYSIEIVPKKSIREGKDNTSKTIKANTTWWYILIIRDDGTAISYNKTLDTRYELKVKTDK